MTAAERAPDDGRVDDGPDDRRPAAGREALRERLMLAALPHVVFDGWTGAALAAGAADAGLDAAEPGRLFAGGPVEALRLFSDWADRRMVSALADADLADQAIGARIGFAIMARFQALGPHREAARRAAAVLAMPSNAPLAAMCIARTVDAAWRGVGDRPADFSFYTKRATLALVYAATVLYWMDDRSEGFEDTRAFLDRRLADVMRIGRLRARLGRLAAALPDPFRLAASAAGRGRGI